MKAKTFIVNIFFINFTEYTQMVDKLQGAFDRLIEKYVDRLSSSDEEIAVEYQIPTPSRKHKLKSPEAPPILKKKKRKSISESRKYKLRAIFF